MTLHFDDRRPGRVPVAPLTQRGAAPVGFLKELPAVELTAIMHLRLWCEGGAARDQVAQDFRIALGMDDAIGALMTFDALIQIILRGARRPLMRHGVDCRCFGGDESAYANMLAAAAGGDREDAMLFAAHLLTGDAAYDAVFAATRLAPALLRIARVPPVAATHAPVSGHKH